MLYDSALLSAVKASDAQRYARRLAIVTSAFIVDGNLLLPLPISLGVSLQEELLHRSLSRQPRIKRILSFLRFIKPAGQGALSSFELALLRVLTQLLTEKNPSDLFTGKRLEDILLNCMQSTSEGSASSNTASSANSTGRLEVSSLVEAVIVDDPTLQAELSAATGFNPSKWLLEEELSGRKPRQQEGDESDIPLNKGAESSWNEADDANCSNNGNDVYNAASRQQLTGLCLSGGGIRSATFCLGVLQTLGERKLLRHIDYLSSVSGGGYIHQWLASWIYRAENGVREVEGSLVPLPRPGCRPVGPRQIFWLRRFASYLTPRRGLFSADTWTMIAIWLRNTSLNQIVLFSFLSMSLLIARGLTYPYLYPPSHAGNSPFDGISEQLVKPDMVGMTPKATHILDAFAVGAKDLGSSLYNYTASHDNYIDSLLLCLAAYFCFVLFRALRSVALPASGIHQAPPPGALNNNGVLLRLVLPVALLSFLISITTIDKKWSDDPRGACILWAINIMLMLVAITFGGQPYRTFVQLRFGTTATEKPTWAQMIQAVAACVCFILAALIIAGLLGFAADKLIQKLPYLDEYVTCLLNSSLRDNPLVAMNPCPSSASPRYLWSIQPHVLLGIFTLPIFNVLVFFATHLQIGIIGRFYAESRREWLARFRAWSAMFCFGWIALTLISRIGPVIFHWLFLEHSSMQRFYAGVAFVVVHAATLYAGSSSKSSGKPSPTSFLGYKPLDVLGIVGAPLAIVLLLIVASGLLHRVIAFGSSIPPFLILGILFLVFGWRVDVNEFSLHAFYRNRIARCYLGATNLERTPDPFTGFDDHETTSLAGTRSNIAIADLLPRNFNPKVWQAATDSKESEQPYTGPYPIFSCTLNLSSGRELAWQERKAASFFFSPLLSGYHVGWTDAPKNKRRAKAALPIRVPNSTFNGFATTSDYAYRERGIQLPNAAAISGAALSPNQGYNSQPALAFLMTLFNFRLGWWLANPRKPVVADKQANRPTPRLGILALISELFGMSGDQTDYVCLSDGGFFDNMGLYELVRRRCRYIIVCDAEQDSEMTFGGIGMAILKCRNDFGVEINLDLRPLQLKTNPGFSSSHYQVGTITYPPPPGAALPAADYAGKLIYIKTSMTGDEPGDVIAHKNAEPSFPQDTTANQWFTESKFESYRRLGQLAACQALGSLSNPSSRDHLVAAVNEIPAILPPATEAPILSPGC